MKSLIEIAVEFISKTNLFEMAYDRARSIELIGPLAQRLAEKMVLVHHTDSVRDGTHWKTTTNEHIGRIFNATFLHKGKRLNRDTLRSLVLEEPLGEYDDYLRLHDLVKSNKSDTKFSDPSPEDYNTIKSRYEKMIDLVYSSNVKSPKFDQL